MAAPCAHVCVRGPVRKRHRGWPLSWVVRPHAPEQRQWRILGAVAFLLAGVAPLGAFGIYLFAVTPELWWQSLSYAFSSENEYLGQFIVMLAAGLFSVVAAGIIVLARRKLTLRGLCGAAVVPAVAYVAFDAWFLASISIMPIVCSFMVQHEV